RLRNDLEGHAPVLDAAELRALPRVVTGLLGLEPDSRAAVGEDVALARKLGNPETVQHVLGDHLQGDGAAHRNMELVRRGEAELRVAELPPPLVTDHLDLEDIGARR